MRLVIAAVGRMRAGPEKVLLEHYCTRAAQVGRGLGLAGPDMTEIDESRAKTPDLRKTAEADAIIAACPPGAKLVVLDEQGQSLGSPELARQIGRWRDDGAPAAAFCIGGADGHGAATRQRADLLLSFGAATWPHFLVRVMLAEQLYRAATILAGHPYHRA